MGFIDIKIDQEDIQRIQSDAKVELAEQILFFMESQNLDAFAKYKITETIKRLTKLG